MVAVPTSSESVQQVLNNVEDIKNKSSNKSSIITIIRGNNFNKPLMKENVRVNLIRDAVDFLHNVNPNFKRISESDFEQLERHLIKQPSQSEELTEDESSNCSETVLLPEGTFAPGSSYKPVKFLRTKKPYSKILPTFFPLEQDDLTGLLENQQVTESQYVHHMLRNVKKTLSENSLFVFSAAYRLDMIKLINVSNYPIVSQGLGETDDEAYKIKMGLSSLRGSRQYYQKQLYDINSKSRILGFPDVFYTFTCNEQWDIILATALSQEGYNIWHSRDEARCLALKNPSLKPQANDKYLVHIAKEDFIINDAYECPYHTECRRVPTESFLKSKEKSVLVKRNLYNI